MFQKIHLIKYTFLYIICLGVFQSYSQEGSPYITNFDLDEQYKLQNWSIIQSNDQVMFFANRKGVLTFDGINWDMISVSSFPLKMYKHPLFNTIYVGCNNDFGYISKDNKGEYNYKSIKPDSTEVGFVIDIASLSGRIVVLSEENILILDVENHTFINQFSIDSNIFYKNIIESTNGLYISDEANNIFEIKGDSLINVEIPDIANQGQILFDIPFNEHTLLGTSDNKLLIFDGKTISEFKIKEDEYLNESILLNGISLSDSSFALTTLIGGVLVIDKKTGENLFIINYSTGLPDDEIFSAGIDINNGLWLSHDLGISRVDFSVPIRKYNAFPGLKGNLLSAAEFDNTIYVGTSESVFYLTEIKDYKEIEVTVKVKAPVQAQTIKKETVQPKKQVQQNGKSKKRRKKKGILDKIKEKLEEPVKSVISKESTKKVTPAPRSQRAMYRKKKILELQSISHEYKKIEGLEDKCKQLLRFKNKLLVGGNNGLYEIDNNKAKAILLDRYINYFTISNSNENRLYICTSSGFIILDLTEKAWNIQEVGELEGENIYSIVEKDSLIWFGTDNDVLQLNANSNVVNYYSIDNNFADPAIVKEIDGEIYAFLPSKIYSYDVDNDSMKVEPKKFGELQGEISFINSQPNIFWMQQNNTWELLQYPDNFSIQNNTYLKLFENIENIYIDNNKNIWVIDNENVLNKILYSEGRIYNPDLNIFISSIKDQDDIKLILDNLNLKYTNNSLKFTLAAPFYIKEDAIQFQYYLENLMKGWSTWGNYATIDIPFIPPGNYTLHIRARNILGNTSSEQTIDIYIKKPFWQRGWFYILMFIIFLALVVIVIRLRERKLQRDKRILEQKVSERTKTIEEQKTEIEKQRDDLAERNEEILQQKEEIEAQRDEIQEQRDHIVKQNEEITHSIQYAKRIQTAVMPSIDALDKILPEYFILFRPRDIVSGDYYWMAEKDDKVIIVAADCTGHGVPGAFMSMLGVSFLNEIVNKEEKVEANRILNQLRLLVKNTLSQTGKEGEAKDGMDMALLVCDFKNKKVQYSGAYNPLYLIRDGKLIEAKPDKMPIGIHLAEETTFSNHEMQLKKGDTLYIFSDGFIDQFGGDTGRKFMTKPFKRLLVEIQKSPMAEQKFILNETLDNWRGEFNQVDDVLIVGIRIE